MASCMHTRSHISYHSCTCLSFLISDSLKNHRAIMPSHQCTMEYYYCPADPPTQRSTSFFTWSKLTFHYVFNCGSRGTTINDEMACRAFKLVPQLVLGQISRSLSISCKQLLQKCWNCMGRLKSTKILLNKCNDPGKLLGRGQCICTNRSKSDKASCVRLCLILNFISSKLLEEGVRGHPGYNGCSFSSTTSLRAL